MVIGQSAIAVFRAKAEADAVAEEEYEVTESDGMFFVSLEGLCGYGPFDTVNEAADAIGEYDGDDENGSAGNGSGWVVFSGVYIDEDPASAGCIFDPHSIVLR